MPLGAAGAQRGWRWNGELWFGLGYYSGLNENGSLCLPFSRRSPESFGGAGPGGVAGTGGGFCSGFELFDVSFASSRRSPEGMESPGNAGAGGGVYAMWTGGVWTACQDV
ncbi:unnamed protein product [Cuscuta europaea]|uniref:Uncharacterized protein n=1 Tax=Cuscuta europaea TaxID=41803 RepID=A0A9P0Z5U5_CUSEU|nr:unnamed protein product [Cuscuta europaea]CAH9113825.1 unnamed protein product [Cuscuta europaea]